MEKQSTVALLDHFASLPDPRIARHRWHKLSDIVVIAVCAVLCGAESYPAIEDFGQEREEWLRQFLELPAGIPSHDTFNRVLRLWDPVPFQACFLRWMHAVAEVTQGEVVAIDGKALRRSFEKGTAKRAIHMVSAWATANGVVLGQRKVDTKSNEITAIPALLDLVALQGCIVTIDAMGCQRAIAQKIVAQGADYVLALKGNQPTLEQAVERFFVTGAEAEAPTASRASIMNRPSRGMGGWRRAVRGSAPTSMPSCKRPRGRGCAVLGWGKPRAPWPGRPPSSSVSISRASRPRPRNLPGPCASTGGLRTSSIGRSM